MAKQAGGFNALWSMKDINRRLTNFNEEAIKQYIKAMAFIGEEFINQARNNGAYKDQTGNLRSSIFYLVKFNGREVDFKELSPSGEATQQINRLKTSIAGLYSTGVTLIVGAGMEYAAYVEANGYDVLTGSAPSNSQIKSDLRELLTDA